MRTDFAVSQTRQLLICALAISVLIAPSLCSNYVYLSRSLRSYGVQPGHNEPGASRTKGSDNNAAFVQTLIIPEQADVGYTGPIRRYVSVNSAAGEVHPFDACPPTVQIQIIQSASEWTLLTIDEKGQNKIVGGDEFYVTYTDNALNTSSSLASAVALMHDRKDGSYSLDFSTTPMRPILPELSQIGTLTVHLQYTCGIGAMAQPSKNAWRAGGTCRATWKKHNVTQPPIQVFSPPTDIDLSPYDLVVSFGDSLMEAVVREPGSGKYFRNNTSYKANIWQYLSLGTLQKAKYRLDQFHAQELNASNVALLLGSSDWDIMEIDNIQGTEFKDHLEACRQLLEWVRKKYPHVDIFWKSPSALHIHRVNGDCFQRVSCNNRLRYMSNSRALYLYHEQKKMVEEMGIPFIDLFEAYYLSADWTMWSDGRHYVSDFNQRVLSWFYSDSRNETSKALLSE
jgi:hypothetical protein